VRFVVVGAGAIGSFTGGILARAGHAVVLEGRGEHSAVVSRAGLVVRDGADAFAVAFPPATGESATPDAVLVAVKAHALAPLAGRLAAFAAAGAAIVTLQNGLPFWYFAAAPGPLHGARLRSVDPDGALAAALPPRAVVACVVNAGARIPQPGVVERRGSRSFVFGEAAGGASARVERVAAAFAAAGLDARVAPDIRPAIWSKLAANAALNPVSALSGATAEAMVDDPGAVAVIGAIVVEMLATGRAAGVDADLPLADFLERTRAFADQRTSMLQDLDAGRPLELGPILDAPLEVAAALGVPAPATRRIAALVHLLERARMRGVRAPTGEAAPT
jgi:2-dehydropantoate 2-reductase